MLERLQNQLSELSIKLKNSKRELQDLSIEIKQLEKSIETPPRLNEFRDEAKTLKVGIQDLNNAYSLLKTKEQHLLQEKKLGKTEGHGMNQHFLLFSSTREKEKERTREAPSLIVYKSGLFK